MESPARNLKILIIANSRFKGGLSGSDAIYESFKKYWKADIVIEDLQGIDFKPFVVCYVFRIVCGLFLAILDFRRFDFVYSSSDFLPDSLSGLVYKIKGNNWIAGFYLKAFKENPVHFYTQAMVRQLIKWFADMVIVTNPTMYYLFPNKKKTWINGGIDLKLAGLSDKRKIYDAVFCGRIHPSKGIDELIDIWDLVRKEKPQARLAVIGDGDLGKDYIKNKLFARHGLNNYNGMDLLGYMGDERYEIYKQSKLVLYPTPLKYDHFSIAPVEAMACGCPVISFGLNTVIEIMPMGWIDKPNIETFSQEIIDFIHFGVGEIRNMAYRWSEKFDYEQQSLRVYNEIKKEIL